MLGWLSHRDQSGTGTWEAELSRPQGHNPILICWEPRSAAPGVYSTTFKTEINSYCPEMPLVHCPLRFLYTWLSGQFLLHPPKWVQVFPSSELCKLVLVEHDSAADAESKIFLAFPVPCSQNYKMFYFNQLPKKLPNAHHQCKLNRRANTRIADSIIFKQPQSWFSQLSGLPLQEKIYAKIFTLLEIKAQVKYLGKILIIILSMLSQFHFSASIQSLTTCVRIITHVNICKWGIQKNPICCFGITFCPSISTTNWEKREQYCELKRFCAQRIIKNFFSLIQLSTQCPSFPLRVEDLSTKESGSSKTHYSAEPYKH